MTAAQLRHATAGIAAVPVYFRHADGTLEPVEAACVVYGPVQSDKVDRSPAALVLRGKLRRQICPAANPSDVASADSPLPPNGAARASKKTAPG